MKIVILEAKSLGDDMNFTSFEAFGEVKVYPNTKKEEMSERITDADVIVVNKLPCNEETLKDARNLKLICVTATGINNFDGEYMKKRGIAGYNVPGYSTDGVAQHTFAMLFYLFEKLPVYDRFVKSGEYSRNPYFSWFGGTFHELVGKTWGIIGLGAIGRRVAEIAEVFGCHVICFSASGKKYDTKYEQVDFEQLLKRSDILSVHAPLNAYTEKLMNEEAFSKMKESAFFLNLARGPIVDEQALTDALNQGKIAAAGLDVLEVEPMSLDSPLFQVEDQSKLFITPHIAWAAVETRMRCVEITVANIGRYLKDDSLNRVY